MSVNFADEVSVILRPPKEVVLRIFNALKYPSPSTGFESANLGSNGKHANQYTNENDSCPSVPV